MPEASSFLIMEAEAHLRLLLDAAPFHIVPQIN